MKGGKGEIPFPYPPYPLRKKQKQKCHNERKLPPAARFRCCKKQQLDRKKEKKTVENVQNATEICKELRVMWDTVIDLQDQIATILALMEAPKKAAQNTAYIYRPGEAPEPINLVEIARGGVINHE